LISIGTQLTAQLMPKRSVGMPSTSAQKGECHRYRYLTTPCDRALNALSLGRNEGVVQSIFGQIEAAQQRQQG
jgi:hypothetical protein